MESKNPYKAVVGKFPTQKELSEWSPNRWLDLLNFVASLIGTKMRGNKTKETYSVTKEKIQELEGFLLVPNHPWAEYIYRVDRNVSEGYSVVQFYQRAQALATICLSYLKRHPASISDEMKAIIDTRPERMGWCLKQYFLKDTPQGQVVVRDQMKMEGNYPAPMSMPSLQKKQMETLVEMVDLHQNLVKSIKKSHLSSDLTTMQKLTVLPKLTDAIAKMASRKGAQNQFTQINIHGGAREMEETMLEYVKQKNQDNE